MLRFISFIYACIFRLCGVIIEGKVKIWPLTFISTGYANRKKGRVVIGPDCELSQGVVLKAYGGQINIGRNTFLGEYCIIYGHGGVEIGDNTLIAMHTVIVSANHTIPAQGILIRSQPDIPAPVKIGSDVWIGAGVKILAGVSIGDGCVIGAGSVVAKSLPAYSVAVGAPCSVIKQRDE